MFWCSVSFAGHTKLPHVRLTRPWPITTKYKKIIEAPLTSHGPIAASPISLLRRKRPTSGGRAAWGSLAGLRPDASRHELWPPPA